MIADLISDPEPEVETIEDYIARCAESIRAAYARHGETYYPKDSLMADIDPVSMQVIDVLQHAEDLVLMSAEPEVLSRLLALHQIEGEMKMTLDGKFSEAQAKILCEMCRLDIVPSFDLTYTDQSDRECETLARAWLIDLCKSEAYAKLTTKELWFIHQAFSNFVEAFMVLGCQTHEKASYIKFIFDGIKIGHYPWNYAEPGPLDQYEAPTEES